MPKPWKEVAASPGYLALPPEEREAARSQYFDEVVAPQVDPAELAGVRAEFDAQTGPSAQAAPAPDFSGVTGTVRGSAPAPDRLVDNLPADAATRVMLNTGEDAVRAFGHHAMKPLHGGAQFVEHGVGWLADKLLPEEGGNIASLITGKKGEPKTLGGKLHRYIDDTIASDDEALRQNEREYQAQVPDGVGANVGAVAGTVAPFLLSGGRSGVGGQGGNVAKFLTRVGKGALGGGAAAAATPVLGDDFAGEKLEQIGIGALTGGALPFAGSAVGALKPLAEYASRFTRAGARKAAAGQIAEHATDLSKVKNTIAASEVPGVRRTLAQESQDGGVATLEDAARQTHADKFSAVDRANNDRRVDALRGFAGDEHSIAAAEQARDAVATPLRQQATRGNAVVDTSGVLGKVAARIDAHEGRGLVQQALRELEGELYRPSTAAELKIPGWPAQVPRDDVRTLYNVRKTIGDWLSADSEKPFKKAAARELLEMRDSLDEALADASPEFAQYLDAFRQGSKAVDRMKVGRELVEGGAGKNILDPVTGNTTLTPNTFGGQARNLDKVAGKATGFKKATAASILQPQDMTIIRAVQDDLNRQGNVARLANRGNSATAGRKMLEDKLTNSLVSKIPIVGGVADALNRIGNDRVREQLVVLLQDPIAAREALRRLPPADAKTLADVLARLAPAAGAAATRHDDQVDAEVVGGIPMPRDQVAGNIARYSR